MCTMQVHAHHFRRIMTIIKSFRGSVYGPCIRDLLQHDANVHEAGQMKEIHCHFNDRSLISMLLSLLRVDYRVSYLNTTPCDYADDCYQIACIDCTEGCVDGEHRKPVNINLKICTLPRNMWKMEGPAFDVDSLASSANAMYVYTLPTMLSPADPVGTLISRILAKRFSLVKADATETKTVAAINYAADMVLNGWQMDDVVLGRRSWIVCRWQDVLKRYRGRVCGGGECSICQEQFRVTDIVLMLPCSHAFHCYCSDKCPTTHESRGGICKWIELNDSCPYCRRPISGQTSQYAN